MSEAIVDPHERRIAEDLSSYEFEAGVDAGMWSIVSVSWPVLIVTITAGDGSKLGMRLLVDGYPAIPPSGQPWDIDLDAPLPLNQWPTGGSASQIFRADWSVPNGNAPYMACDRVALTSHPDWAVAHPTRAWNAGRGITFYVGEVHHELRGAILPEAPR